MSSTFHAVVRGPSFTGLGKRPVLMPAHHVDRPTGIGPSGARIEVSRTKPERGRLSLICSCALSELVNFILTLIRRRTAQAVSFRLKSSPPVLRVDPLCQSADLTPRESHSLQACDSFFADAAKSRWIPLHANWISERAGLGQGWARVVPVIHNFNETQWRERSALISIWRKLLTHSLSTIMQF